MSLRAMALPPRAPTSETTRSVRLEVLVVLAVTLGGSALRAVISFLDDVLKPAPLASQSVAILAPRAEASWTDLAYQLTAIGVGLAWGALALYLLWRAGYRLADLGFGWRWSDLGRGAGLAALIGLPGLGFYIVAYRLGLNVTVIPTSLTDHWWTLPVLLLAAVQNGFLEETLMVGWLLTRLQQLRVSPWLAIGASAALRGCYHLYQGGGQAIGNLVMGLVFGYVWWRWRRLWPLLVAHVLIDVVAFVGYTYLGDVVQGWLT